MLRKIIYHPKLSLLFKAVGITHFTFLIIDILYHEQKYQPFINSVLLITLIIIMIIVGLRGLLLFAKATFVQNSKRKFIKESLIVACTIVFMALIFLDDEIEDKILFFIDSFHAQTSIHLYSISTALIILFLIKGIIEIAKISDHPISNKSMKEQIKDHITHFIYKIITGILIVGISFHSLGLHQISLQIFNYTKAIIETIIVVIIIIITGLWGIKGGLYLHKLYRGKK